LFRRIVDALIGQSVGQPIHLAANMNNTTAFELAQ